MSPDVAVGGMAILLFLAMLLRRLHRRRRRSSSFDVESPDRRLRRHWSERKDYQIYIGLPVRSPRTWVRVSDVSEGFITAGDDEKVLTADVRAFIVAYPGGNLVDGELCSLPLPPGISGLERGKRAINEIIHPSDLVDGNKRVQVEFGESTSRPGDLSCYSTTLTNLSNQRLRVTRFAGYVPTRAGYRLNTVTGTSYSAEEFREWYSLGDREWIAPGESVTDRNNYGARPVLWAYFVETQSGEEFLAGGLLEGATDSLFCNNSKLEHATDLRIKLRS